MPDAHRLAYARAIAAVVVIAAIAKWLPLGEPFERFGFGDPLDSLARDAEMLARPGDDGVAWLRGNEAEGRELFWRGALAAARRLDAEAAPDEAVFVRGLRRNRFFLLLYTLYPRRVIGKPLELGSLPNDPPDPEADWLMTVPSHLDPVQFERLP